MPEKLDPVTACNHGQQKTKCLNCRWKTGNKCRTGRFGIDSNGELRLMLHVCLGRYWWPTDASWTGRRKVFIRRKSVLKHMNAISIKLAALLQKILAFMVTYVLIFAITFIFMLLQHGQAFLPDISIYEEVVL
ncbi:MAG: hypothetical protein A4E62_00322 [Syntrophorhabdus sp. PtaU1.Bin002]|nr:MAG: hypothetical protein A4E62_00322 [Syntrophorhabdus sp. PtaU1.Bin002]